MIEEKKELSLEERLTEAQIRLLNAQAAQIEKETKKD